MLTIYPPHAELPYLHPPTANPGGETEYRRFGRTDWQVSAIGLGGSWFYGRPEMGPKPVSYGVAVVERALALGINYFDTAPLYGKGRR